LKAFRILHFTAFVFALGLYEMAAYGRGSGDQDFLGNVNVYGNLFASGTVATVPNPTGNVTVDTGRIQAVQDRLTSGGTIVLGAGTYNVSGLNITRSFLNIVGQGRGITFLKTTSGDLMNVGVASTNLDQLTLSNLTLWSATGGGDILVPQMGSGFHLNLCTFYNITMTQDNDAKFIVHGGGEGWIECVWERFILQHTLTGSVSPMLFTSSTVEAINQNTFRQGRCINSGLYFFDLRGASSVGSDNFFSRINFEVCNGGCIRGRSVWHTTIVDCDVWDITTTTNHLFEFSQNAGGANIQGLYIRNLTRHGGTLGGGFTDIFLHNATVTGATIEGARTTGGSAFSIDLGPNTDVTLIEIPSAVTVTNRSITTVQIASVTQNIKIGLGVIQWGTGSPETVVTAPIGSMYLRTDGGAITTLYIKESGAGNTGWVAK